MPDSQALAARVLRECGQRPDTAEQVIESRSGSTVVVFSRVAVKLHQPGTHGSDLAWRLATAAGCRRALLAPLRTRPVVVEGMGATGSVLASIWPRVSPLQALSPDEVDWPEIGAVLARLHCWPPSAHQAPGHGGQARLGRAAHALSELATAGVYRYDRAANTVAGRQPPLPETAEDLWARFSPGDLARLAGALHAELVAQPIPKRLLVHGDWHLGQVARTDDGWRFLDVDDLGLGDPAWDLGRPAGAWAAGLLDETSLTLLLDGYRRADGPALPPSGDPWPRIDLPARCSLVIALYGLLRDRVVGVEAEQLVGNLVGACARMAALSG